jgi:hypothetical protein
MEIVVFVTLDANPFVNIPGANAALQLVDAG